MVVKKLPAAVLRRLAVRASVTPATIAKVYSGQAVRGLPYFRALAALHESGLEPQELSAPFLSVVRSVEKHKAPASRPTDELGNAERREVDQ
jgi:hypothetical protein